MRTRLRLASLHLLLLLSLGCAGAGSDGGAPHPSARDVVDAHVRATGIDRRVAETSSLHARGRVEIEAYGIGGTLDVFQAKPDRLLVRTDLGPAGKTATAYDGEVAWTSHPALGTLVLEGAARLQLAMDADYETALLAPEDLDALELEGIEEVEGRACYRVVSVRRAPEDPAPAEATLALRTRTHWFAVDGGLQVAMRQTQESPQGPLEILLLFDDYTDFGGYRMPARTRQRALGVETVFTIEEVAFDAVDPAVFERPEAVRSLLGG